MFCNQLKYCRQQLNITQQEMAHKLNVSRQCYSGYEQGTREPNLQIIRKLCVIFGCTADELLEIETAKQRKNIIINK